MEGGFFGCRTDGGDEGWLSQKPGQTQASKQVRGAADGALVRPGATKCSNWNLGGTGTSRRRRGRVKSRRRRTAWCHSHGLKRCWVYFRDDARRRVGEVGEVGCSAWGVSFAARPRMLGVGRG